MPSEEHNDLRYTDITINTKDGYSLSGVLIEPLGNREDRKEASKEASKAESIGAKTPVLVHHPATGVNLHLYRKFAEYVVREKGWPTLIYDLRGSGESFQTGDEKRRDMRMSDWILKDVPGATAWMRQRFPDSPLYAMGHSVGGHGMLASYVDQPADRLVQMASHAGVTATVRGYRERMKIWTIFNLITPICSRLLGFIPVEQLGMGKTIPVGVMTQWSGWTRKPNYFFGDPEFDFQHRFNQVEGPVLSVVLSDDPWAHRGAVNILTAQLRKADITKLDIPAGQGTSHGPVGHMGFYRSKNKHLWPQVVEWLDKA